MLINTSLLPESTDLRNQRAADSSPAPAGVAPKTTGADASQAGAADNSAAVIDRRYKGDDATPTGTAENSAALTERRYSVDLEEDGAPGISDAAGAEQVTASLRATFLSQPGTALAAQGNPNPESAYNLLI